MKRNQTPGLFVTGTDTEVGKTYVAALVAQALAATGLRVGVYKPAASGCTIVDGKLASDDAAVLWNAAGRPGEFERVCPQTFAAPLAPHLAARGEGRELDYEAAVEGVDYWRERSDIVIVEGAGGLMSPLGDDVYAADLALDVGYPLIVVAPNRLGIISNTLCTLVTAATFRTGLDVAGVVVNDATPDRGDDASRASNAAELAARCVPPVLACVQHRAARFDRNVDWRALARAAVFTAD